VNELRTDLRLGWRLMYELAPGYLSGPTSRNLTELSATLAAWCESCAVPPGPRCLCGLYYTTHFGLLEECLLHTKRPAGTEIWAEVAAFGRVEVDPIFPATYRTRELRILAVHIQPGAESRQATGARFETAGVPVSQWVRDEDGAGWQIIPTTVAQLDPTRQQLKWIKYAVAQLGPDRDNLAAVTAMARACVSCGSEPIVAAGVRLPTVHHDHKTGCETR
jgi:hypothetical protein